MEDILTGLDQKIFSEKPTEKQHLKRDKTLLTGEMI